MNMLIKNSLRCMTTLAWLCVMPTVVSATIVAFDGSSATLPTPTYAITFQNNIWNAAEFTSGVITGPGQDITSATNGFVVQSNSSANLPVSGVSSDYFLDFAAGVGNATTARGTVYAFDVAPGTYSLDYSASWESSGQAAANVFIYDTTTPVSSLTADHRVDFNTGSNNAFYGGFTGVDPGNVGSVPGFSLVYDSGVLSGPNSLGATTSNFTLGADDLVIFRIAGQGWGDNASGARLDLLRLNVIPEPGTIVLLSCGLASYFFIRNSSKESGRDS